MKILDKVQLAILIGILVMCAVVCFQIQNVGKQVRDSGNNDSEIWMERMYVENNIYETIRNQNCSLLLPDNISGKDTILVCYYSALSCGTCVDFAMAKIEEYFPNSDEDSRILFIAYDFNEKVSFEKKNTIKLLSRKTELPINENTSVCYFVLTHGVVEYLFIPEKSYETYTDIYLTEIKNKLFS